AVYADLRTALEGLAHGPEKCAAVFRPGHAQYQRSVADGGADTRAQSAGRIVFVRPKQRSFADGREPAAADVSACTLREIRWRQERRARSVRGRRDGRTRPGYFRPQADHVR